MPYMGSEGPDQMLSVWSGQSLCYPVPETRIIAPDQEFFCFFFNQKVLLFIYMLWVLINSLEVPKTDVFMEK